MKTKKLLIYGCLALSNLGFSQLDEYESTQTSMISEPEGGVINKRFITQ
jgi:hypothetical protein